MVSDLGAQYKYIFYWFKDVLDGKEILTYSFSKGLGGDMLSTYFYYLSSPINFLLFFIPKNGITNFCIILIFVKLGLCGSTMYIYLDSKKSNLKNFEKFLLAISYALMGYNITYFFNIIWLDIILLTPIVVMGVDKIFDGKKSIFYIFFLFLSIVCNYYMSYMLCLFLIFYFIYKWITLKDKTKIKDILIKFILSSIIAALLASFVLVPVITSISDIFRLDYDSSKNPFFNLIGLLYNFGIRTQYKTYKYTLPYIHSTFFVVVLIFNCLFNSKIKNNKKIFFLIIIFFSFFFTFNDELWYFSAKPSGFLYRYSFFFTLMMIIYISDFYQPNLISKKKIGIISIIYILIYVGSTFILKKQFNFYLTWVNPYLLISFFLINNLYIKTNKRKYIFLLIFLTIIELYIALNASMQTLSHNQVQDLNKLDLRYHNISMVKNDYYRINSFSFFSDRKSTSSCFVSTNNKNIYQFSLNTGSGISSSFYSFYGNDLITRLLGYKYDEDCDIKQNCKIYPVKATSIGYMIDNKKVNIDNLEDFNYSNAFINSIYDGAGLLYKKYNFKKKNENEYIIYRDKYSDPKIVYVHIYDNSYNYIDLYLNNKKIVKEYLSENNVVIGIKLKKGKNVLRIKSKKQIKSMIKVYSLDEEKLDEIIDSLNKEPLIIENIDKNKFKGKIDVISSKKTLLITIPYKKNWNILVDGKKANYYEIFDTFIGLDLEKGQHKIEMYYEDNSLKIGLIISSLTLILCLIYNIFVKKRKNILKI